MFQLLAQAVIGSQAMQCVLARILVTLLFGIALASAALLSADEYLCAEIWRAVLHLALGEKNKLKWSPVLLTPLEQLALEVHFLTRHLVNVEEARQYALDDELLAVSISPIEVDCPHEGLECVSRKITIMHLAPAIAPDELVEPYFHSKSAERLALHYLASGVGEKAFAPQGKVMEDDFADDSIQHGIPQKLQPFVVELRTLIGVSRHRFVHQGLLIEANVSGIKAKHIAKDAIKFLFLAEREPYRVYQIYAGHDFILRIS